MYVKVKVKNSILLGRLLILVCILNILVSLDGNWTYIGPIPAGVLRLQEGCESSK